MNAVEIQDLTKIFDNRLIAVNRVNLDIPKGSVFGLVGSNGAGKTTTLRLIMGLNRPTAGAVHIFGEPIGPTTGHLRRRMGFLSQTGNFPPYMNPISYLDLTGRLFSIPKRERRARLSALIHAVELLPASFQRIDTLSTGMRTRLGIAASLINDPEILLWDEPTIGLDPTGRKYTLDLIKALRSEGKTVILSTHVLPDADQVCDLVGILNHGKLIFNGSVTEMKKLIHREVVDLALEGNITQVMDSLATEEDDLSFEQINEDVIRVSFRNGRTLATDLNRVLDIISRQGVEILSIRSADEIEDAFLKHLEEDRQRGFTRPYISQGADLPSPGSP